MRNFIILSSSSIEVSLGNEKFCGGISSHMREAANSNDLIKINRKNKLQHNKAKVERNGDQSHLRVLKFS